MANIYDTLLVCKSNKKLLHKIDPRNIIKESNSEFISCKNGIYYFATNGGTMHENIVALSEKYPKETFIAKIWNVDFHDSEIQTFKYKSGKAKCTKAEPNYGYSVSHIEKVMGKKLLMRFMKVAMKQIKTIDKLYNNPTAPKKGVERKYNIHSSYTIIVEDMNYKIKATKKGFSYIDFRGYIKKNPTPSWQLIEKEKTRISREVQKMGNKDEKAQKKDYKALPF